MWDSGAVQKFYLNSGLVAIFGLFLARPQAGKPAVGRTAQQKGFEMTNEEMMIILERALLIPVKESDAAYILAIVEERLRNESRPTTGAVDCGDSPAPEVGTTLEFSSTTLAESKPAHSN